MEALDNFWYYVYGHKLERIANTKRAENEVHIVQYKDLIAREVHNIPEENLQDPPMSIVGPALEASKYYIEEEELRKMFAKVIGASMDSTKSEDAHHSFVEIIKQLSPRDARNLSLLKNEFQYPIAQYTSSVHNHKGERSIRVPLIFSSDVENGIIDHKDFPSISNLIRLGLLTSSFTEYLKDEKYYNVYYNNYIYDLVERQIDTEKENVEVKKGVLEVTPIGSQFLRVCL